MQTPQLRPKNDPIAHITIPDPQAHVVLKFIAITFQKDFLSIWWGRGVPALQQTWCKLSLNTSLLLVREGGKSQEK